MKNAMKAILVLILVGACATRDAEAPVQKIVVWESGEECNDCTAEYLYPIFPTHGNWYLISSFSNGHVVYPVFKDNETARLVYLKVRSATNNIGFGPYSKWKIVGRHASDGGYSIIYVSSMTLYFSSEESALPSDTSAER